MPCRWQVAGAAEVLRPAAAAAAVPGGVRVAATVNGRRVDRSTGARGDHPRRPPAAPGHPHSFL